MADITQRNNGQVDDVANVNWRGDQVAVPQGGQSIYKTSSIQLAQLGSRKVVGDRVFRYAKAEDPLKPGDTAQYGGEILSSIPIAPSVTQNAGLRTITLTAATEIAKNTYSEGYLVCEMGATCSNRGMVYRIRSNALGSSAGTCVFTLYDPIIYALQTTGTWSVHQNLYMNVDSGAVTQVPVGVSPVYATTGDYFWLQTWGPATVVGTAAKGDALVNSVSGLATIIAASDAQIGTVIQTLAAATNNGLVFLTIAP